LEGRWKLEREKVEELPVGVQEEEVPPPRMGPTFVIPEEPPPPDEVEDVVVAVVVFPPDDVEALPAWPPPSAACFRERFRPRCTCLSQYF
jgi:hypothetical protein